MGKKSRFIQLHDCNFLRHYMGKMRLKRITNTLCFVLPWDFRSRTLGQCDFLLSPCPMLLRLLTERAKDLSSWGWAWEPVGPASFPPRLILFIDGTRSWFCFRYVICGPWSYSSWRFTCLRFYICCLPCVCPSHGTGSAFRSKAGVVTLCSGTSTMRACGRHWPSDECPAFIRLPV